MDVDAVDIDAIANDQRTGGWVFELDVIVPEVVTVWTFVR